MELLVLALDRPPLPDPVRDRAGRHQLGDIITVQPDGWTWGKQEGLPTFVRVRVPGVDPRGYGDRAGAWDYRFRFETVARDEARDGWRLKVGNLTRKADGQASPVRDHLRQALDAWKATYVRTDEDGVVLDWTVGAGGVSPGLWDTDPATLGLVLEEVAYDPATGVHTFRGDWTAAKDSALPFKLARRVLALGGGVVSTAAKEASFTLPRERVLAEFRQEIEQIQLVYRRHRYAFPTEDVDKAVQAGGLVTLTLSQVLSRLIDHQAG